MSSVFGPIVDIVRTQLASRAERLGWQPSYEVALAAIADGTRLATQVVGGEAFVAIPDGTRDLRLRSRTHVPAQFGEADARRLGLMIYALTLVGAEDGFTRSISTTSRCETASTRANASAASITAGRKATSLSHRRTLPLSPAVADSRH